LPARRGEPPDVRRAERQRGDHRLAPLEGRELFPAIKVPASDVPLTGADGQTPTDDRHRPDGFPRELEGRLLSPDELGRRRIGGLPDRGLVGGRFPLSFGLPGSILLILLPLFL